MKYNNNSALSRYERPSAKIHTICVGISFLMSGGKPDSLTIVDATNDDDFNY